MSFALTGEAPMGKLLRVRRHRLDNGLTVVSLADHSAPIIAYHSWFGVGSKHETLGATGMAHLFEHLMFNQTKSLALGDFDRAIESIGGETNAATWVDWTYYRTSIPANQFDLIARLEAERMTDLVLEPEVVEAEREVVMNERLERVDDDIDGTVSEELFRTAFEVHPYGWPTIGWMDDIKGLTIEQMRDFYATYYAPDNVTLVVVGDFDEATMLATIERHYGNIAPANVRSAKRELPIEPVQTRERRLDLRKPVSMARLVNGYRGPGQKQPDWAAASFCCQLLAGSASAPLHRTLVIEHELAASLHCEILPWHDPNLIEIGAIATPGHTLDELQRAIDDSLERVAAKKISDNEIDKVRNRVETEFWGSLHTADGKAEALGHYQSVHGDFEELFDMSKHFEAVDSDAVAEVMRHYFQTSSRTVVRVDCEE